MLKNASSLAIVGLDTAENGPSKVGGGEGFLIEGGGVMREEAMGRGIAKKNDMHTDLARIRQILYQAVGETYKG